MNEILAFDHTTLAQLISRRWQEDRPYFTPNKKARGAWLEGSWWRQPANGALKLHWSRRSPPIEQTVFARMALQKRSSGDPV
jgi:predicted component of type VI protein secretion system